MLSCLCFRYLKLIRRVAWLHMKVSRSLFTFCLLFVLIRKFKTNVYFNFRLQINPISHDSTEKSHFPVTLEDETLKNQTKSVLLAELVSMELFYGLEDLLRLGPPGMAQGLTSSKLYSLTDKDLLLHSAETLLEVL